tara:strand:+ start:183 stop:1547 length:1365 start_codon:yes stop_codon:yes gene_type:complete
MGGATIELAAIAINDNEIVGNPQITFFKSVFKRHTNFSIESREIINSNAVNFGSVDAEFTVRTIHHLLTNVYAEVVVSGSDSENNKYTVNNFGNSLIKEATLIIGGKTIETLYSQWLQIYHELVNQTNTGEPDFYHTSKSDTTGGGKNMTYDFVSDNTAVRTPLLLKDRVNANSPLVFGGTNHDGDTAAGSDNKFYKRFFVPLPFFFTRNIGLALPLCALSREEIKIKLSLESSDNLKGDVDTLTLESFKLYGDFVLLEGAERQKFQQSALTYLIETAQRLESTTSTTVAANNSFEISEKTFSLSGIELSIKFLCWVVLNSGTAAGQGPCNFASLCDSNENGNDGYYGKASILLNNEIKQEERAMSYYTRYLPQRYCKNHIPDVDRIGIYSFALTPFDYQPSGTCNFNRLTNKDIKLTLANNTRSTVTNKPIHFFAVNYNILTINGGISGLKYK